MKLCPFCENEIPDDSTEICPVCGSVMGTVRLIRNFPKSNEKEDGCEKAESNGHETDGHVKGTEDIKAHEEANKMSEEVSSEAVVPAEELLNEASVVEEGSETVTSYKESTNFADTVRTFETNPAVVDQNSETNSENTAENIEVNLDEAVVDELPEFIDSVWSEWKLEKKPIGRGSYGTVYRAVREDFDIRTYSAIKVISIPANEAEWESVRAEGYDDEGTRTYFYNIVKDFADEIRILQSLKSAKNVVGIEDYRIIERTDRQGWDINIRMELLTPLNMYLGDRKMTEQEVIRLGCDICEALEVCEKKKIIHRDVKPENIFVNEFGDFKLGDFGVARKLEHTVVASYKGSPNYMAPEVFKGEEYDSRVDIYSLGVMLYRFLNNKRLPFVDTQKSSTSPSEREKAWKRRVSGDPFPKPCEASAEAARVILKACAFKREDRYGTAREMLEALRGIDDNEEKAVKKSREKRKETKKKIKGETPNDIKQEINPKAEPEAQPEAKQETQSETEHETKSKVNALRKRMRSLKQAIAASGIVTTIRKRLPRKRIWIVIGAAFLIGMIILLYHLTAKDRNSSNMNLSDLKSEGYVTSPVIAIDAAGRKHEKAIVIPTGKKVSYMLDGEYKHFSCVINPRTAFDGSSYVTFLIDGVKVVGEYVFTNTRDRVVEFDVDGVEVLTINVQYGKTAVLITDDLLTKD